MTYGFEVYASSAYTNYGSSSNASLSNLAKLCQAVVAYGRTAAANS